MGFCSACWLRQTLLLLLIKLQLLKVANNEFSSSGFLNKLRPVQDLVFVPPHGLLITSFYHSRAIPTPHLPPLCCPPVRSLFDICPFLPASLLTTAMFVNSAEESLDTTAFVASWMVTVEVKNNVSFLTISGCFKETSVPTHLGRVVCRLLAAPL